MSAPIPVSILTGFLGAGKTTLLNHILRERHGYRFAVIVNELGQEGIDGALISRQDEEIVQLSNGCVCCTVRKDLVRGVQQLLRKGGFDYLLVETTGIADPGPVAQTFLNIPALTQMVRLDSIITVVDAEQVARQLKDSEVTREQIAMADFILLNKIDLVEAERLDAVEAVLHKLNPHATVIRTDHSKAGLNQLLDMNAFDVDQKLAINPCLLDELQERSHGDINSFSFVFDKPFVPERLEQFVQHLAEHAMVFRSKGILWMEGNPRRAVFHGVNNRFQMFWDRLWEKGETRQSRLVFIGRELARAEIEQGLAAALA